MARRRSVLAGLSTALIGAAALVLGGLSPARAPEMTLAAGDNVQSATLATWNMQGGSDSVDSKWTTGVAELARQNDIVALQEAGPGLPSTATHRTTRRIEGFEVTEGLWPIGRDQYAYVYFLPVDTNGHRVNLAMVTREQVALDRDVIVIPPITRDEENAQPEPPGEGQAPANDGTDNIATATNRPMLGLSIHGTVYYDIHARARSRGRDAPEMLGRAAAAATHRAANWVVLGDFNRAPSSMTRDMPEADQSTHAGPRPIGETRDSGGATHLGGGNLDYMVTNVNLGDTDDYVARRHAGRGSDHIPVEFGNPLARSAAEFSLTSGQGALDVENGTTGFGAANGDIGTMYYPTAFDFQSGSAGFVSKRDGRCLANRDGALVEENCDAGAVEQDFTFDKAASSGPYDVNLRSLADDKCVTPALTVQIPPYDNLRFGNCDRAKYWTYRPIGEKTRRMAPEGRDQVKEQGDTDRAKQEARPDQVRQEDRAADPIAPAR